MYCNNVLNLEESTIILNAYIKKKSGNILKASRIFRLCILASWLFYGISTLVGYRVHSLDLCMGVRTSQESVLDMTSNGAATVLELWGIYTTPSLPLLPSPLRPGVVARDKVLTIYQIEPFDI